MHLYFVLNVPYKEVSSTLYTDIVNVFAEIVLQRDRIYNTLRCVYLTRVQKDQPDRHFDRSTVAKRRKEWETIVTAMEASVNQQILKHRMGRITVKDLADRFGEEYMRLQVFRNELPCLETTDTKRIKAIETTLLKYHTPKPMTDRFYGEPIVTKPRAPHSSRPPPLLRRHSPDSKQSSQTRQRHQTSTRERRDGDGSPSRRTRTRSSGISDRIMRILRTPRLLALLGITSSSSSSQSRKTTYPDRVSGGTLSESASQVRIATMS